MNDLSINKYRKQLMGIAAIGVLLVHSRNIIVLPKSVSELFSYGGIGVYIFVFLSSIGLYSSLKTRGGGYSKIEFYKRRFKRAFVPYLLIAGTWYGVKYILIQHDILAFFYELSTLSFWIDHQGAWYVAMLFPIYLIFPYFFDWIEGGRQKKVIRDSKIIGIAVIIFVIASVVSLFDMQLYSHLSQVFSSVIVYIIGYYCAEKVMTDKYNGWLFGAICIVFYVMKAVKPLKTFDVINNISWSLLAVPIITVSTWFLSKVNSKIMNDFFGFFGKHSLEMYLWNIFLIQAIEYSGFIELFENQYGDRYGYISYGLVIAVGIILSVVYGKISDAIASITCQTPGTKL